MLDLLLAQEQKNNEMINQVSKMNLLGIINVYTKLEGVKIYFKTQV